MNRFIKDWERGSMPDGSDPPRVTLAAKIAIASAFAIVVGFIILSIAGVI